MIASNRNKQVVNKYYVPNIKVHVIMRVYVYIISSIMDLWLVADVHCYGRRHRKVLVRILYNTLSVCDVYVFALRCICIASALILHVHPLVCFCYCSILNSNW